MIPQDRRKWTLIIMILLVAGGMAALWGIRNLRAKSGPEVFETARARRGPIRDVLVETGIIKPRVGAQVKLGSRATGQVIEMRVKVGDRVTAGDIIARIDDREIVQAIDQKKAAIAAARERIRQIETTYPRKIEEARAEHEYARVSIERTRELVHHEFATRDALDKATAQFEVTKATLGRVEKEYTTELAIARANLKDLGAQLDQQETRLGYTLLRSPMDGIVSDVTIREGETVVTGLQVANLVTILNPDLIEMWIYVDESDIGKLGTGETVEYTVDTYPERTFRGILDRVYPQPVVKDNITYYLAIVPIPVEDAQVLRPEMTTYARIVLEEKADALTVPNAAVKYDEGKQVVYRTGDGGKVEKTTVTTGIRGEEMTEILAGLAEGDTVATRIVLPKEGPPAKETRAKP